MARVIFLLNRGEDLFRNQPISNKNCLWWPCLLTDRNKMNKLYIGPSIDASYQVLVHLAKRFQRRRFLKLCQSETSQQNNHLSPQNIERKKKPTYGIGNPGPCLCF
jgi:hypothetical protein